MDKFDEAGFSAFEEEFSCVLQPCSVFSVVALALFVKAIIFRHCLSFFSRISSKLFRAIVEIEESFAENQKFFSELYKTCISKPSRFSLSLLSRYCAEQNFHYWLGCISRKLVMPTSENEADFIQQTCQELDICIEINGNIYNTQKDSLKILIRLHQTSDQYSLHLTGEEKEICQSSEEIYINFFRHPYIYIIEPNISALSISQENIINFSEDSTSIPDTNPKKTESTPIIGYLNLEIETLKPRANDKKARTVPCKKSNFIRYNQRDSYQEEKCQKCGKLLNVYNCSAICIESECYLCNKCRFKDLKKCVICEKPYGEYESTLKVIKLSYGLE